MIRPGRAGRPGTCAWLLLLASAALLRRGRGEPISLADFRTAMEKQPGYSSPEDAFAVLDAGNDMDAALDDRPLDINEFIQGTSKFSPALSGDQAKYAFQALDANHDGSLVSSEFAQGLAGEQFPTLSPGDAAAETTAAPVSEEVSLEELERRIEDKLPEPSVVRSNPGEAFKVIDPNSDGVAELAEFVASSARFSKPLTEEQANDLFSKLDSDSDGYVFENEFLKQEHMQEQASASGEETAAPMGFDEYKQRLDRAPRLVGVLLQFGTIDPDRLSDQGRSNVVRILVLGLADAAGVSTEAVKDLEGTPSSVSLSQLGGGAAQARLRRLAGGSLAVEAVIWLPSGATRSADDVLAAISTEEMKAGFASDLNTISHVREAAAGDIYPESITVSGLEEGSGLLLGMDADHDGSVNVEEFIKGAKEILHPSLTREQAESVFRGLDANFDGVLSVSELAGKGMTDFVHGDQPPAPPDAAASLITMAQFKAAMGNKPYTPEEAFQAFGANPANLDGFTKAVRTFQPPLNDAQARNAFQGMDVDRDGLLTDTEFYNVLKVGGFSPSKADLRDVATAPSKSGTGRTSSVLGFTAPIVSIPLHIALGYLLLFGYLMRTLFLGLRLPGVIGVVLSGMLLSYFMPVELSDAGDQLQELLFFLLLFTAGFDVSLADIRPFSLITATFPATCELLAITVYGATVLGFPWEQAFALGGSLFALGGSIVSPKMSEMAKAFPGHPMPRLMSTWASLEGPFALAVFGTLAGMSRQETTRLFLSVNIVRIIITVCLGAAMGYLCGKLVPQRRRVLVLGRKVFTGAAAEAFLMVLAVGLVGYGVGSGGFVRMGFGPQALLQPEILVVAITAVFALYCDAHELEDLERCVGGVWLFGQVFLFSLLGASTDTAERDVFGQFFKILLMMGVGLAVRLVGIFAAMLATMKMRQCPCSACRISNNSTLLADVGFAFLCSLPRSTIQGSLGTRQQSAKLLGVSVGALPAQIFIGDAARLYVVLLSGLGSVLLDIWGPRLLEASARRAARCDASVAREQLLFTDGWTQRQRELTMPPASTVPNSRSKYFKLGLISEDGVLYEDEATPAFALNDAVKTLAEAYRVDPSVFTEMIQKTSGRSQPMEPSPDGLSTTMPMGQSARVVTHGSVTHVSQSGGGFSAPGTPRSPYGSERGFEQSSLLTEKPVTQRSRTTVRRIANISAVSHLNQLETDGYASVHALASQGGQTATASKSGAMSTSASGYNSLVRL